MADHCTDCIHYGQWWICTECVGGDYYEAAKPKPKRKRKSKTSTTVKNGEQTA